MGGDNFNISNMNVDESAVAIGNNAKAERSAAKAERNAPTGVGQAPSAPIDAVPTAGSPQAAGSLRILYLTAAPHGDLRVDQDLRIVREAVRAATYRELVAVEPMAAATDTDLLDGLARCRPHVVHFSGHGSRSMLEFDGGSGSPASSSAMSARTFVNALNAVDRPPRLVVLNSCHSAAQLEVLTTVVAAAVGMSDRISDKAAIAFAARFYAALAEGQSVASALALSRIGLEMSGFPDAELLTLRTAPGVDPASLFLVDAGR
ncbi:CHAT domain-containing protein [Solwaraspora sp. WMMD792]|uniref:CHAT domain-containing protein n=1 Tax=Solwaraspora sp. WMMD792 TaxID=3016099 RepID=UPI00241768B0|nr:CHAT domain-containing protein [Solwaraspora sp. WMMD792]MDG4771820.1 CHAT domain-containing protein [Solwaraspora sp. WMMD792]